MNINKQNKKFAVIGCGRLGISLAVFLSKKGFIAHGFSSKSMASAQKAMEFAGSGAVFKQPCEAVKSADIVFLTTPDTTIEPVCEMIAQHKGFSSRQTVFHLSGALSSKILEPAKSCGAAIGSIHPLQAFAPYEPGQASQFKAINISIEGDDKAVELGQAIVEALEAQAFTIPTHSKTLYHAAAVVASNYLVTLEHFALELLKQADLSEPEAYRILEPLIMGTLKNIRSKGSVKGLTGPVARGDHKIVSHHLNDIDEKLPQFSMLYRLLGRHTLEIADQGGSLNQDAKKVLEALFKF
ncbi:MAG: Rossmann-like and DUF2520 domain-containing protein [Pseudomonadota bacterium]